MAYITKVKSPNGTIHVRYISTATDSAGNTKEVSRTLGILDTESNELLRGKNLKFIPADALPLLDKKGIAYTGRAVDEPAKGEFHDPSAEMRRLFMVMRRLRAPDGCPWDREQTHETLKECLIGEVAEYLDAVNDSDDKEMREELGDVLMQVVMNSVIAEERGAFNICDVIRDISDKMIRRHPHVFGEIKVANTAEVLKNWDAIKKTEKGPDAVPVKKSPMDRIPRSLPALFRAQKMQTRAAKHGFDWDALPPIVDKIHEEMKEFDLAFQRGVSSEIEEEAGDLLFSIVNFLRFRGNDAEEILNRSADKFSDRYRRMEAILAARGKSVDDCDARELDDLWNQAKRDLRNTNN